MIPIWILWVIRGLVVALLGPTYVAHRHFLKKRSYAKAYGSAPAGVQKEAAWKVNNALAEDDERKARLLRDVLATILITLLLLSFWLD